MVFRVRFSRPPGTDNQTSNCHTKRMGKEGKLWDLIWTPRDGEGVKIKDTRVEEPIKNAWGRGSEFGRTASGRDTEPTIFHPVEYSLTMIERATI